MNSNLFQTILTVLLTACGVLTSILLAFGCTQDITGAINCTASSAPEWLVPWLVVAASALGIVKLITGAIKGQAGGAHGGRVQFRRSRYRPP